VFGTAGDAAKAERLGALAREINPRLARFHVHR
jgi:hypothetical protein